MADFTYLVGPGPRESRPPFIIRNGRLLSLDDQPDVKYLVQISDEAHYPKSELPSLSSLATVLSLPEAAQEVTIEWLSNSINQYINHDDVWHPAFLQGIVLNSPVSQKAVILVAAEKWLREHNTEWIHFNVVSDNHTPLRLGPHVLLDDEFREVVRLYPDTNATFMLAVDPWQQSDFAELDFSSSGNGTIDVAVPSRLQHQASPEKPLMNLRIAVKDSFHLRGVPTSICNRSYRDTYGKQPTTAASIKTLVDAGCIVVGKVKMTAFDNWEEPVDYIDFEAPWNPRADGHQSSGGSSSGSAAASAAYEWLDIAMGADTAGSIMRPALWGGVFGLRPSFHAVSNAGMAPSIVSLDTPCFMGRDLQLCKKFAEAWYGKRLERTQVTFKRVIWTSDYWRTIGDEQVRLAKLFTADLEKTLEAQAEIVSFEEDWAANPPAEANGLGLQEYMTPGVNNIWYDDYHNADAFREQHWKLFDKAPYIDPFVTAKWSAQSVPNTYIT
ncbi:hypothetical protein LTR10_004731 [Elasticomyces elasticus]|nr:hypothetical protein LTR10_004731 [Elasticomyces elasticus]KAK4977048.1 hypothetical protein LTR42_003094 [Elasticomyces elasticus]